MRVAIDTNGLFTTQAGVARYIRGLMRGLEELQEPDLTVVPVAWEVENFGYRQPERALKTAYREFWWANVVGPKRLRAEQVDLLHSPVTYFTRPPKGLPHVITLCDLAFLVFPERFRTWQRLAWRQYLKKVPSADRLLSISQFTVDEAKRLINLPTKNVVVVHLGCDFHPDQPPPKEAAPEAAVPEDFFLFVGSLEPGKNLALLRTAYERAADEGKALPPLMIVGARWEGVGQEGPPPPNWHYLGRQPDEALVYLYRRARALLFPSKYEGFGLPIVEAMALGCPVVCSRVASLPEVGGEAVRYVELEPQGYLQAMLDLCQNDGRREEMIAAGLERSKRFSWKRCAAETLAVYREAVR